MINKFYKIINNNYLNYFKIFFFLKYLLAIFLIASASFLLVPKLLNYEKKIVFIKKHLSNYYDLQLQTYKTISYNVYPSPNIKIIDAKLKTNKRSYDNRIRKFKYFLKLSDIYQLDNSSAKNTLKIILYLSILVNLIYWLIF